MANEKTINARLQQKHDIKAHWELATKFIPKAGEIIVYDDLNKIKIGDGTTYVNKLPFTNGSVGLITKNGGEIFNDYKYNAATAKNSHAEGQDTRAEGACSHSEGFDTYAFGLGSHAEGHETAAKGIYSHAEGGETRAIGANSHAEGYDNKSLGDCSHAEGSYNIANGHSSHAEGGYVTTGDKVGYRILLISNQIDSNDGTSTIDVTLSEDIQIDLNVGEYAHLNLFYSDLTWYGEHRVEIKAQPDSRIFTIQCNTATLENYLSIENTIKVLYQDGATNGDFAIYGHYSHAEGYKTKALGHSSHAEGYMTQANGNFSHASGLGTIAYQNYQTVVGKYNQEDEEALFIIGNGSGESDDARSNAFTVNKEGSATISGNLQVEGVADFNNTVAFHDDVIMDNALEIRSFATVDEVIGYDGKSVVNVEYLNAQLNALITVADIDAICGGNIVNASEVTF